AICAAPLHWSLGLAWPGEIDEINILNATFRAMSRAVVTLLARLERRSRNLPGSTGLAGLADRARQCPLYIDGSQPILLPQWQAACGPDYELPEQKTLVRGDSLLPSISAASILAKTWRDRLMLALDRRYPGYAFAAHKGYGTAAHLAALRRLGPCPQHRRSFAGVESEAQSAGTDTQFSLF
ncbi:MAG: ribonuclease HII, partial [Deltaproteobacteria bacterium]|nr:ribonuclease HII [Deltaproteobacteria bacterium]